MYFLARNYEEFIEKNVNFVSMTINDRDIPGELHDQDNPLSSDPWKLQTPSKVHITSAPI